MRRMALPHLATLRRADWMTGQRARAYSALIATAMFLGAIGQFGHLVMSALNDPKGRPIVTDFNAFWSGARLAVQGHAALAYDITSIRQSEHVATQPTGNQFLPYLYPPIFLFLTLPLGFLAYLPAMAVFETCGYGLCCVGLRRLLPSCWGWMPILGFPASMMNATMGQNGFVSAALFACAAVILQTRPFLAGACLGFLAFKPQLALCIPIALFAARRWVALTSCGVTALFLILLSWVTLGTAAWDAFLRQSPMMREVLAGGDVWPKLLSVFAGMRLLGAGVAAAYMVQAVAGLIAVAFVWRLAVSRPGAAAEVSLMILGAFLSTPYVMDYDLVCLGVPLAWMAGRASNSGWLPWEKAITASVYVLPLFARNVNIHSSLPVSPLLFASLLALTTRRIVGPQSMAIR